MNNTANITQKLQQFGKKQYINELIKGSILFISFGLLYLFFTLFIEYFLWLQPTARTVLFWIFIGVELFLFVRFICFPIFKLIGLQKGISFEEAAVIIGNHFPEVSDKLTNLLQLQSNTEQSDLLLASIAQKSKALQPIPFTKAIDFTKNKKYLKYAVFPLLIWMISLATGTNGALTKSLERVVNHRVAYIPPAPFSFLILTKELKVIQGKPITIQFKTIGKVVPNEAKILFDKQQYFLQNNGNGTFSFTFSDVTKPIDFYVEANGIQSQNYLVSVIKTPTIQQIEMVLQYPRHTKIRSKIIKNTGNAFVPEGTVISWKVTTFQTDSVAFMYQEKNQFFTKNQKDKFGFSKRIRTPMNYQISTSNNALKNYETLPFTVEVLKDAFPQIAVTSNIDSVSRGTAQFAGQISDDYGIKKLELVYYDVQNPQTAKVFDLQITKKNIQSFYYQFPDGLDLKDGIKYELFFRVFDNDGVNGSKKTISKKFQYQQKSKETIEQELLKEQKNTIQSLESTIQHQQKNKKELEKIQQNLQKKKNLNWNDKKKIENYVKRQQQYKKMMQRQTDQLQENFDEKKEKTPSLQEKKEQLKKRIAELKKMQRQQKLLDQIKELAKKLNKEDLVKKTKELAQQNKQQERSLERILEMTKRFYVEQKTAQIADKIEKLAKKQEDLANKKENNLEAQKEINEKFKKIEEELKEVEKDNQKLKEPMELPDTEDEQEDIKKELNSSEDKLQKKERSEAKKNQKKASKKMKQMSKKMQKSMMDMQGDSIEENMEDLRKILENLITFSYKQESLMQKFTDISTKHPSFGKSLKKQHDITTYFNHIDDSLYVLSIRMPKLSAKIQDHLASAHYNLDESLENFTENRFSNGISNQRYVMTAANSLADYLSSILTNMKNSMSMSGKGKSGGKSFSLPDLIEKQKGLSEKMKEGMKKGKGKKGKDGKKPGDKGKEGKKGKNGKKGDKGDKGKNGKDGKNGDGGQGDDGEQMNGDLYRIYQEQAQLRQQLQNVIKEGKDGNGAARKALKTMEELENEILTKGFNQQTLQKMQRFNYELLKLDKAFFEQGEDKKRKSTANIKDYQQQKLKELQFKRLFYKQTEILNRQSLPLRQNYKKKVQEYFSTPKKKD